MPFKWDTDKATVVYLSTLWNMNHSLKRMEFYHLQQNGAIIINEINQPQKDKDHMFWEKAIFMQDTNRYI